MMFRISIILLLFTLPFSACRKDEVVVEETEIIVPPSEEINVAQLTGIVNNRADEVIPNTKVYLLENNEIIAETTSDENGFFQFNDIFVGNDYSLLVDNDAFVGTFITLDDWDGEQEEVVLIEENALPFPTQGEVLNPLDADVVFLTGTLLDTTDEGIETVVFALGAFNNPTNWSSYVFADENGDFRLPIKTNSEIILLIENVCESHASQFYGPYNSDFDIGTITIQNEVSNITISGTVTDCDENPVEEGFIGVFVGDQSFETTIENGFYEINVPICSAESLQVLAFDTTTSYPFPPVEIDISSNEIEYNIELCDDYQDYRFDLTLNNMPENLGQHFAFTEIDGSISTFTTDSEEEIVSLYLTPMPMNTYELSGFFITLNDDFYIQIQALELTITSEPSDNFIAGHISGQLLQQSSEMQVPVSLDFNILKFN